MRYRVLPYKQGSRSAKALAEALNGKVLKLVGSRFRQRPGDKIINWGNVERDPNLRTASNKLHFFQKMTETGCEEIIPRYWRNQDDIPDDAFPVVCRTVLAGHSGEGIVIADSRADLVPAPLYTQYVKKKHEYRIHVGKIGGDVTETISVQQKRKREGVEADFRVRNLANGFVFCRGDIAPPPRVVDAAHRALLAVDIPFGAVDVIYNERQDRAYVLEINTAPGLEGQTVLDYASFFMRG